MIDCLRFDGMHANPRFRGNDPKVFHHFPIKVEYFMWYSKNYTDCMCSITQVKIYSGHFVMRFSKTANILFEEENCINILCGAKTNACDHQGTVWKDTNDKYCIIFHGSWHVVLWNIKWLVLSPISSQILQEITGGADRYVMVAAWRVLWK